MNGLPPLAALRRRRALVAAFAVLLVVVAPVCRALCGPADGTVLQALPPAAAEPCPGHAAMASVDAHDGGATHGNESGSGAHGSECCGEHEAASKGSERPQSDSAPLALAAVPAPPALPVRLGPARPPTELTRAQGPPLLQRTLRFRE
jgi:hypothetical protein